MINKTFTKKDLLEFIDVYEITIDDPSSLSKKELQVELENYLLNNEIEYNSQYDFHSSEDLLNYFYYSRR